MIKCQLFECFDYFYVIGGMDFGWDYLQVQVQFWWDKDVDIIYVLCVWKVKEKIVVQVWGVVKLWVYKVLIVWFYDGNQYEKGGGEQFKGQYVEVGFMMLQEYVIWFDGGNVVESGIIELCDMMFDGCFKVFNICELFFEEFCFYYCDENGKIVKFNDDVFFVVCYVYMMCCFVKMMCDIKKLKEKKILVLIRFIVWRI